MDAQGTASFNDYEFENLLEELLHENSNTNAGYINDDTTCSSSILSLIPSTNPNKNPKNGADFYFPFSYSRKVGGRRRSINPSYMPELRIFRRDIRRRYAEMFVNVANHHDPSLMGRFVHEFCRPECIFETVLPTNPAAKEALEKAMKKEEHTVGMAEMVQGFSLNNELMPDLVFRMKECQVRVRQGSPGSLVSGRVVVKGTRLFSVEFKRKQISSSISEEMNEKGSDSLASTVTSCEDNSSAVSSISISDDDGGSSVSSLSSEVEAQRELRTEPEICGFGIREASRFDVRRITIPNPVESVMEALLFMTLDEMHRIQKFQFSCQNYQERSLSTVLR